MRNFTRLILVVVLFYCSTNVRAQVGIGIADPDTTAVLDITSNDKGVLFPRIENHTFRYVRCQHRPGTGHQGCRHVFQL